jgi:hypothetical protein
MRRGFLGTGALGVEPRDMGGIVVLGRPAVIVVPGREGIR